MPTTRSLSYLKFVIDYLDQKWLSKKTSFSLFSVKIGLFYIVYYAFLTGFFMAMLFVFYQTLDDEVPKWLNSNGIIGDNPGMTFIS